VNDPFVVKKKTAIDRQKKAMDQLIIMMMMIWPRVLH
jgi:hypothetical protein